MSYWGAIAQIAGWLTLGGTAAAICIGFGIWFRIQALTWAGAAVIASTITYGVGVSHEKVVCDARFVAARAAFQKLQDEAKSKTDATAAQLVDELAKKEKVIDDLASKYEALESKKAVGACAITADDLRRGLR